MSKIGFIGQGFIGKNYADDFENRGYDIVRYSLEEPYVNNREKIKECKIVFVAVPTPSTPVGFDDSILIKAIENTADGTTVVIKSTLLPGRTEDIQSIFPNKFIFHSPEFLTEVTASHDAANPNRNIVGTPRQDDEFKKRAKEILSILPKAPYEDIVHSKEAELTKYGGNIWFYFKVIFINMLYDIAQKHGIDYEKVKDAMAADPRIGSTHLNPVHKSGRGAGGHCFIKDFAAFTDHYAEHIGDENGLKILEYLKNKNLDLLLGSKKDLDLLVGVYGNSVLDNLENSKEVIDEIKNINEAIAGVEPVSA